MQELEALQKFIHLHKQANAIYQEMSLKQNLSSSVFDIFYAICILGDGCLQRDICEIALISKQTINSSIKKLEKSGYLRLIPGKGKEKHIYLTEAGKQVAEERMVPVIEAECRSFHEMTVDEQELLLKTTETYLTLLEQYTKPMRTGETKPEV